MFKHINLLKEDIYVQEWKLYKLKRCFYITSTNLEYLTIVSIRVTVLNAILYIRICWKGKWVGGGRGRVGSRIQKLIRGISNIKR